MEIFQFFVIDVFGGDSKFMDNYCFFSVPVLSKEELTLFFKKKPNYILTLTAMLLGICSRLFLLISTQI